MRSSSSWLPEEGFLAGEGTKRRLNRVCAFVEYPKTGTTRNSGPVPYRAAWSLSIVDGESIHAMIWGKPSVARTLQVLPTQASDICLQCPSLPHSTNEQVNLNKRTPLPSCVRVEIRH